MVPSLKKSKTVVRVKQEGRTKILGLLGSTSKKL